MRRLKDGSWMVEGLPDVIPPCSKLTALLVIFKDHTDNKVRENAYWDIADILWNDPELPEPLYVKHEWSERMIREAIENKYLAVGGSGSSGKSHVFAGWGIINWMSAPHETLILMTSTTLREARKRIWGSFIQLVSVLDNLPLRLRDSIGAASYETPSGKVLDKAGIHLIAAEKSKTRDAVGKFIGLKQKNIILIADELADLSEAIVQAGLSNLSSNPNFSLIGLANPDSRFDAFGVWSEPKGGWDSIVPERDFEWTTRYEGKYIRFDAEESPNISLGHDEYPWLPTQERVDEARAALGPKSRGYMRMFRAVFFDSDENTGVFTEIDLQNGGALQDENLRETIRVAGCDPAFTNGGDRTVFAVAEVGYDRHNHFCLRFIAAEFLFEDQTNTAVPRTYQIAQQIIKMCEKYDVEQGNLSIDSTGAGAPFCDVVAGEMGHSRFARVQFASAASDARVSANSQLTGKELYSNRVTEIWFMGRELLRCKQLRGITPQLAKEMVRREFEAAKSGDRLKMRLEGKLAFKQRLGMSPDTADAYFLAMDGARQRLGLWATEPPKGQDGEITYRRYRTFKDLDVVSQSHHAHLE